MGNIKKLFAALIVAALCLVGFALAEATGEDAFEGEWVCDGGSLFIEQVEDGCEVVVYLETEDETQDAVWTYLCRYDEESGALVSAGEAVKTLVTYDGDGDAQSEEEVYADGAAAFSFDGDGAILWKDEKEDAGKDLAFVRPEGYDEAVPGDAFVGEWLSDGGAVVIEQSEGEYLVSVVLEDAEADRDYSWLYACAYDEASGRLVSTDYAAKTIVTYGGGEEAEEEEVYTDGSASFGIDGEGRLIWDDAKENAGEGLAFESADAPIPGEAFIGDWVCDRAIMEISGDEEGFSVNVTWANDAYESTVWGYICRYDEATDSLVSTEPAAKAVDKYDDDGELVSELIRYQDGEAVFSFDADGNVIWDDAKENAGEGMAFEPTRIVVDDVE